MVRVEKRENENFDKTIRRFETECRKAGILRTYKSKSYFVSRSERRHRNKERARRRLRFNN